MKNNKFKTMGLFKIIIFIFYNIFIYNQKSDADNEKDDLNDNRPKMKKSTKQIISIITGVLSILGGLVMLVARELLYSPPLIEITSPLFGGFLLIMGVIIVYNYSKIKSGRGFEGRLF